METNKLIESFGLVPHVTEKTIGYIGKTFNKLTVKAIGKKPNSYRYVAICVCSCGKTTIVRIDKLNNGHTQSCGCFHMEQVTKHGLYKNPLYHVWECMMSRCYTKTDKRFVRYGGRGITVCDRWHTLENFIFDMFPTFSDGLQIDRINNDLGYFTANCKWSTHSEQQRNRSNNLRYTINGTTRVLSEWCRIYNITYRLARERIVLQGWNPEDALTIPVGGK